MARILVADDEKEILSIFTAFLTKTGFEIVPAPGGAEAINCLRSGEKIDLVVLDMEMPQVKGLDVLQAKKDLRNSAPVIIVTGSMVSGKTLEALAAFGVGREDVLPKPVDLFVLLDTVRDKLAVNA